MNKFIRSWKVTEMEQWEDDCISLVEPGYSRFSIDGRGEFVFGTVTGLMDCRFDNDKDSKRVEFSWDGTSEHDPVCCRGWFEVPVKGELYRELYIHNGDDSWVKAVRL